MESQEQVNLLWELATNERLPRPQFTDEQVKAVQYVMSAVLAHIEIVFRNELNAVESRWADTATIIDSRYRELARLCVEACRLNSVVTEGALPTLERVASFADTFETRLPDRRKPVSEAVRRNHVRFVLERRGGICPCCGSRRVVRPDGTEEECAQIDHMGRVDENRASDTWLICQDCNQGLGRSAVQRVTTRVTRFLVYQQDLDEWNLPASLDFNG